MNEESLRAMVRDAIARHRDPEADEPAAPRPAASLPLAAHASHYRYALAGSGGACLIEPEVQCNHCGYCQSHGH
jgi:hypothetical protein